MFISCSFTLKKDSWGADITFIINYKIPLQSLSLNHFSLPILYWISTCNICTLNGDARDVRMCEEALLFKLKQDFFFLKEGFIISQFTVGWQYNKTYYFIWGGRLICKFDPWLLTPIWISRIKTFNVYHSTYSNFTIKKRKSTGIFKDTHYLKKLNKRIKKANTAALLKTVIISH